MDFVHLHTHSEFSILDSTDTIEGLLDKAEENDMEALALTDHGNIGGAVKFYKQARDRGIKPIIGCELYVAPESRFDKDSRGSGRASSHYSHLVVLATSNEGYYNLVKLSTMGYTEGFYYKPRVDDELLEQNSAGLIALSGCKSGEIPKALLREDFEGALKSATKLQGIFGQDNFFIELQDQGLEDQQELNEGLVKVAKTLDVPVVATNDVHYLEKEDKLAHEVLLNIQANKKLTDEDRRQYDGDEYYFKSTEEMEQRFHGSPQVLRNTVEIARRCDLHLSFDDTFLPPFELPDEFDNPEDYLRNLVFDGARQRWEEVTPEIRQRLDRELGVIEEMGYPTYFLIVRDFIRFARDNGIPVGPGRGSAAASAVAYCLHITDVDPLKHGLLFERFLNPARVSMPDIDIDFCQEGRDEVIDYVIDKYGSSKVAQIATFDTMAARSAVRDVARVMDIPYDVADEIAKAIPPRTSLSQALENIGEIKQRYGSDDRMKQLFDISLKVEGLLRNASTHAAGVVIAPDDLTKYTPLQKLSDGEIVTQFDMNDLEEIGLLKMDFLGLRNLTIIDRTLDLIEDKEGNRIDLHQIPFDDDSTFELLREGKTAGVFQLESTGMQGLLKRLQPEEFQDIIASNALYRPGPLESGMADDYIERKRGRQETQFTHPELKEVLEETYGLPIYQEQIMKMAQVLAGFSLAQADKLRKAMGKKKKKVMAQMKEKFITGCVENDISKREAQNLFADIEKFSRYGFNKAHSTAYAYISYWTVWLKANYPAQYMASLLTSVGGNEDKVSRYVKECEEMGIEVLPPDINESERVFTPVSEDKIRFGLGAIKYVGDDTIREVINSREEEGYKSFFDFCRKVDSRVLNSEALESLVKVGAMEKFGTRKYLLSRIKEGLEVSNLLSGSKRIGQKSFFDQNTVLTKEKVPREEMDEFDRDRLLKFEKDLLGLFITGDPLQNHQSTLELFCDCPLDQVEKANNGSKYWLGGRISELSQINTRKGDPMAFVSLDDGSAEREFIVFPGIFEKVSPLLIEDNVILVRAKVGKRNNEKQFVAEFIVGLDSVWEEVDQHLILEVDADLVDDVFLDKLEPLVKSEDNSNSLSVKLVDTNTGRYKVIQAGQFFKPRVNHKMVERLRNMKPIRDVIINPQTRK